MFLNSFEQTYRSSLQRLHISESLRLSLYLYTNEFSGFSDGEMSRY